MPEASCISREIRVVRPADHSANEAYFSTQIAGNTVTRFGLVDVGGSCLQLAYAQTDAGAYFPLQYHRGGIELAVILSGEGAMITEDHKAYPFEEGDIVIVPAEITYRVVNSGKGELRAWIFFSEETRSYWPDGSPA